MAESQAPPRIWSRPHGVLGELVAAAERRVEVLARDRHRSREVAGPAPTSRAGMLADALRGSSVAVIAEVKRRSPSKGTLNGGIDAALRATAYASGGAAAISVLTEPERFGGSLDDLAAVRAAVAVPVVRKDFIVDALQLHEAVHHGAGAILLIARALAPAHAADLAAEATALGLGVLYEVRDEPELERAVAAGGCVIGVNTRNLETLEVDRTVGERLLPLVPTDRVAVYESGIATRADVERAADLGANAVLVGSVLSTQPDGVAAVRALAGVPCLPRRARG